MSSEPTNLHALTMHAAADLLRRREISAVELTQAVFDQIDRREPVVHAYITLCRERALAEAAAVDSKRAAGEELSPLAGVPLGIKDNLCTHGVRTTCASRILDDFRPPYDATVIERLKASGAVLIGKTNMDEFAMGSSNEYSAFGPTTNPWNPTKVPGGSSGGSAAAVAAGEALGALGSDTGGSVRLPASFCGVVGLKPTYGRVSRYGLVAFGSSLDQIGPLTRDVTDSAMLLNAIAGHDPNDSTTLPWPVPDYTRSLVDDVRGLRIGVPKEYFVDGMHPGVTALIRRSIERLEQLGAQVGETSLPNTRYALAAYYIVAPAEASSNLARYDGVKYGISIRDHANGQGGLDIWESFERTREAGFGPEVKRRIMLGTYALSSGYYEAYYLRAMKVRTLIKQDFERAFGEFDVLAVPTAPTVAFTIGERVDDPVQMYLTDVCTITVNAAGIPALSVPCGLVDGLPVGLQLLGPSGGEETLFRVGYTFEQYTEPLSLPF